MLALVVYESMFGNTAQVATAIASGLREWVPTDVVEAGEAPVTLDEEVVLVVAGGPTHAFSMSRAKTRAEAVAQGAPATQTQVGLRDWLQTVTPGGAALATFDTRADKVRHLPGSAAHSAARMGGHRGFAHASAPQSFFVGDVRGPLLVGELFRAREWGRALGLQAHRAANRDDAAGLRR